MANLISTFRDRDRGKDAAAAAVLGKEGARGSRREAGAKRSAARAGTGGAASSGAKSAALGAKGSAAGATTTAAKRAAADDREKRLLSWIPSPRAAGALVICMVALGTIVGAATSQIARSAGVETIVVAIAEEEKPPPPEEEATEPTPPPQAEEATPVAETPAPVPLPEEPLPEEPLPEEPLPEEPLPEEPLPEEELVPFEPEGEELLPEVKHLFLIVLGESGFEESFGPSSPAPYLAKTLVEQGELLTNYYAVSQGRLANEVALLSGQGPTPATVAECPPTPLAPTPTEIVPGTVSPEGQVEGEGCVYPAAAETLPDQLAAAKPELKWRAYVQETVPGVPDPRGCPHPFSFFHSLLDGPECLASESPISKLAADLEDPEKAPALSYIVPNACHVATVVPCEPGQPSGPAAAEPFLREVVPQIVKSKAYAEGGLLLVTAAEAPHVAPVVPEGTPPPPFVPDTSSCCGNPAYPNLPPLPEEPPTGPVKKTGGGGHVGLLLLSSFVAPGSVNEITYANHFTLLLTIEELLGLEKLGYANEPALLPFDSSVFNAATVAGEEEESTSVTEEEEKEGAAGKGPGAAGDEPAPKSPGSSKRAGADAPKGAGDEALLERLRRALG